MSDFETAARKIDLLLGEDRWASILVNPDGHKTLDYDWNETKLASSPPLQPYEGPSKLQCVAAVRDVPCILLVDDKGRERLQLADDDDGELLEVVDPRGEAYLQVSLQGPGSDRDHPTAEAWFALKLRRVVSRPGVMLGVRVIRNTRITTERILRRLAAGASEADLLRDYPQITSDDIREVLLAAAKAERDRILQPHTAKQ